MYWAGEGVRIFRVDNPHTKPLPFWQWMIADVRARYPDVIFLAEAFTRPKMMYRLAKVGFTQSYTYFTWRNTKRELTEYLVELTTTDVRSSSGRTSSSTRPTSIPISCRRRDGPDSSSVPLSPRRCRGYGASMRGSSSARPRRFPAARNISIPRNMRFARAISTPREISSPKSPGSTGYARRIRRCKASRVKFYNAYNDQVLLYGKMSSSGADMILVAVSLDPHNAQDATFELPLWEWKLPDHGSLLVEDLMRDQSSVLTGKLQHVRLDPADLPFAVWRIAPAGAAS